MISAYGSKFSKIWDNFPYFLGEDFWVSKYLDFDFFKDIEVIYDVLKQKLSFILNSNYFKFQLHDFAFEFFLF